MVPRAQKVDAAKARSSRLKALPGIPAPWHWSILAKVKKASVSLLALPRPWCGRLQLGKELLNTICSGDSSKKGRELALFA